MKILLGFIYLALTCTHLESELRMIIVLMTLWLFIINCSAEFGFRVRAGRCTTTTSGTHAGVVRRGSHGLAPALGVLAGGVPCMRPSCGTQLPMRVILMWFLFIGHSSHSCLCLPIQWICKVIIQFVFCIKAIFFMKINM